MYLDETNAFRTIWAALEDYRESGISDDEWDSICEAMDTISQKLSEQS
jgi:hypothetical protein